MLAPGPTLAAMNPDWRRFAAAALAILTGLALLKRRPAPPPPASGSWEPDERS